MGLVFTLKDMNDPGCPRHDEGRGARRLTPALECLSAYLRNNLVYPPGSSQPARRDECRPPFFMVIDPNAKGVRAGPAPSDHVHGEEDSR